MVLTAWSPSGGALYSRHECALTVTSDIRPDMTVDTTRMLKQQHTNT